MKRLIILFLFLIIGTVIVMGGARNQSGTIKIKMAHNGDTLNDRYVRDTVFLFSTKYYAQGIDGRIIFDSTKYDTGAFGNADTIVMVLKSVFGDGALAKYTTLDSVLNIVGLGVAENCTLNVSADTDSLGEKLLLIYRMVDTLDAGVDTTSPGLTTDTARMTIRYNILHRFQD